MFKDALCALLKAVGMLWLKLDINSKILKQDTRLLAVFFLSNSHKPPTLCHMGSVFQLGPDGLVVP